jgi:CubicO group peptidase (beta-lactamase class C family)
VKQKSPNQYSPMKFTITSIFLFLAIYGLSAQDAPTADELLTNAIAAQQFAGINAGVAVGDEVIWLGADGYCSEDRQTPCNINTRQRIASISKTFTAVAALQLQEKGLLDFDLPIVHYLPDYPAFAAQKITARQLLHHTAGIGGYLSGKETETTKEYATLAEAITIFQGRELLFEPGTQYQYSTYGYVLLGRVIEVASGQSFNDYIQINIFDKAGMAQSGVDIFEQEYQNKSAFFYRTRKGKIKNADANNLSNRVPGGGIYSNAPDMLKFGQALLNGTLLQDSSLALMQTYPDVDRGKNNPYGMGLFLYGDNPTVGPVIGHSGEQTGAAAQMMLFPEKKAVIIVLSNTALAWRDAFQLSVNLFPLVAK